MKHYNKVLMFAALLLVVFAFVPAMHAQSSLSTSSIFQAPTTQSPIAGGLNEVLKWVFIFLKFLAVIACGWGSYQIYKGELSSGIWAYVAALALFFSPALVDLASNIGATASGTTTQQSP
jgi:hypothetical protein